MSPTPFTPPEKTVPASVQREKQSTHPCTAFFAPSKVERPLSAAVANRYASVNAVIGAEKRVGAVKHGLELAADAVVVDGRCKHQHIRIVHFGGNFHGIVLDNAVPQL